MLLLIVVGLAAGPGTQFITDNDAWAKKRRSAPRKEPQLKIIEVNIKPVPYVPQQGDLEFSVTVDLPPDVERAALLEVTALISSPSRSSLRFLSYRESIEPLLKLASATERPAQHVSTAAGKAPSPRVHITLTWDGKDHTKQEVSPGTYHYELRAKVIGKGDNTPRALTVSWPKRGTLAVK
ncbi:hypothetical protein YTPLAS18_04420 [Nitrospira sp.]|nr:hypothetical protein YTPLAS18_04420 [Nitrospira sp.]